MPPLVWWRRALTTTNECANFSSGMPRETSPRHPNHLDRCQESTFSALFPSAELAIKTKRVAADRSCGARGANNQREKRDQCIDEPTTQHIRRPWPELPMMTCATVT